MPEVQSPDWRLKTVGAPRFPDFCLDNNRGENREVAHYFDAVRSPGMGYPRDGFELQVVDDEGETTRVGQLERDEVHTVIAEELDHIKKHGRMRSKSRVKRKVGGETNE